MTAADYSHARHIANVQKAARAAGVKGAAFAVLAYMCSVASFKRPTVCVSKATICNRTAYHWDTVRLALRSLRDLGLIEPIAYETGGRERATVYKLTTKGLNGVENPPPNAETEKGGGFSGQKGAENPAKRGRKIHPPSVSSSISIPEGERTAYSGGAERTPLDEQRKQELALFSRECGLYGYEGARARELQRKGLGQTGEIA